ncbi:MAG: hypothetical protein KIG91_06605 [Treponema sp.]|nr:hypothetical protein [Treponema sp.]
MVQGLSQVTGQVQKASQKQIQRMSQKQIQAVRFLTLSTRDLREEIYKAVEENPALEIEEDVSVNFDSFDDTMPPSRNSGMTSDEYERALENLEDNTETLQEHLLSQLNSMNIPQDVQTFCTQLIYNLDKNGCFGSGVKPETFLDRTNPHHDQKFIEQCIGLVQGLDPIGCCAKNPEDSLLVQAKIIDSSQTLAIFLLDGNLEMVNPPEPSKVLRKVKDFQKAWHSKAFAPSLPIDSLKIDEDEIQNAINFILSLNPHPAAGFVHDSSRAGMQAADIALIVEKKEGSVSVDDFEKGIIRIDDNHFFAVRTPSGYLPRLRIVPLFQKKSDKPEVQAFREKYLNQANDFLGNLHFRESSILLQGCQIVLEQKEFFIKGPGNLKPLTRRYIAQKIGVHESTVSRATGRHNPRFVQTEFGLFPLSYFFQSGVSGTAGVVPGVRDVSGGHDASGGKGPSGGHDAAKSADTVAFYSADSVKYFIKQIEEENEKAGKKKLSDQKICDILNEKGVHIARRTVNKYRKS